LNTVNGHTWPRSESRTGVCTCAKQIPHHTQLYGVGSTGAAKVVFVQVKKYGESKALDLSEWGRPIARVLAQFIKSTPVSVIQITNLHLLVALFSAWLISQGEVLTGCILLVVKGVLDAVDGELARIRERPSHVGRYWDTVADTIGLVAVTASFGHLLEWSGVFTAGMVLAILFQYSLFNHYSILLRALGSGDTTSRVDERRRPTARPWERQRNVNILHAVYVILFSWQDSIVSKLTGRGSPRLVFELTLASFLGYGFQSLILLCLAIAGNIEFLPHLVLGVNSGVMAAVVVRSHLG
jgi:phosphatidylglycerophosphate synthase